MNVWLPEKTPCIQNLIIVVGCVCVCFFSGAFWSASSGNGLVNVGIL